MPNYDNMSKAELIKKLNSRGKSKRRVPIAPVLGLVIGTGVYVATSAITGYQREGWKGVAKYASANLIGYDPYKGNWNFKQLKYGLYPILGGFAGGIAVHKGVSKVGGNQYLPKGMNI